MRDSREIPGFPGYVVLRSGYVERSGRRLKPWPSPRGHLKVYLYAGGIRTRRYVHQLVIEAFGPPCPGSGYIVLHRDDDKLNNAIGNLRWGTHRENTQDAIRNGVFRSILDNINGNG
jgi:hypothetical protein